MDIQVSTFAGCGKPGFRDGKVEDAAFNWPSDICTSEDGTLYIAESGNHYIRMISGGIVSTFAGCGRASYKDGKAKDAMFNTPYSICLSDDGKMYISDSLNHSIRMISDGVVSTVAGCGMLGFQDGKAENAMFNVPKGISLSFDNNIYISDSLNHRIRMLSDGIVSTIAGCDQKGYKDGKAEDAKFDTPSGLCITDDGKIYVTDYFKNRIRMIADGKVTTVSGCGKSGFRDGIARSAIFHHPSRLCMGKDGAIYIIDHYNHQIRMMSDGLVSTIAGCGQQGFRDGKAEDAMFNWPEAAYMHNEGEIYIADGYTHRIRLISGLPISTTPFQYFELSSLLHSESLPDMTLTINNHQYHLHIAFVHSLCPLVVKYKSIIEDAKISHESLQTMFEMIYSNNTIKIRKSKPDQYQMADLTHLVELIWLFESFEINNQSFVTTCVKLFETETKYLMKHNLTIESLTNGLIGRRDELVALNKLHGLQTTKLVQINHFINQNNENQENDSIKSNNNKIVTMSMHDMFVLLGLHTEPRVVDQQQIKSETVLKYLETPNTELKTQPDYTIMTHDRSYSIKCHKLILYAKWSYFRRMIESGLLESASGEIIMSEDWNETRLFDFVKYLYTHEVGFESKEDCRWILDNAELYELVDTTIEGKVESKTMKDFKLLIRKCRSRIDK